MKIVDSHAHFWNVDKFEYPWLETDSFLYQNFFLSDYQQATRLIPVEKIIFVECDCNPAFSLNEVAWVEEYAKIDPRIQGIVAHVELTDVQKVDEHLEILASKPLIKGVRHNIQGTEPGFSIQSCFIEGIKKVQKKNMHFELCITHDQLAETIELIKRCPEVRLVLDHCAKPGIRSGSKEPWMSQMRKIAKFENVICKISGLLTEADLATWTEEEILVYANHAVDTFGTSRIMFGSDWPVNELAGGYTKWYELTCNLTRFWSNSEREDFFYNNANLFYRLNEG